MFKVSRKSEYALIAVQHMSRLPADAVVSVAELAVAENIPQDILAKVLQGLKRAGVLSATKGAGGGYRLSRPVHEMRFLDVVRPFEEQIAVVSCHGLPSVAICERTDGCGLRDPMAVLNAFVVRQFESLTMEVFLNPHVFLRAPARLSVGLTPEARSTAASEARAAADGARTAAANVRMAAGEPHPPATSRAAAPT